MTDNLNASKSDSGPEDWMPPSNQCAYIEWWIAVKIRWALSVDAREQSALISWADSCPSVTVLVRRA